MSKPTIKYIPVCIIQVNTNLGLDTNFKTYNTLETSISNLVFFEHVSLELGKEKLS